MVDSRSGPVGKREGMSPLPPSLVFHGVTSLSETCSACPLPPATGGDLALGGGMRMEELPLPLTNFSNQAPEKALHFHWAKEKSWSWYCEFSSAGLKRIRAELAMLFAVHCIGLAS